jgi:hypothetical protein
VTAAALKRGGEQYLLKGFDEISTLWEWALEALAAGFVACLCPQRPGSSGRQSFKGCESSRRRGASANMAA